MERVETIEDAVTALKRGEVLVSSDQLFVLERDEQFLVQSPQWSALLSKQDFCELFGHRPFWIYEKKEETISSQKDEEYYRWRERWL